jgi:glutathione S-transferase
MPKLYTYKEFGNSYKVRLLAVLLGIDLELVEMDFLTTSSTPLNFLLSTHEAKSLHVDGNLVLTDSAAIQVYLAGKHPDYGSSKTPS